MIRKRILAIILCICMCLSGNIIGIPLQVWAADEDMSTSGTCGENTTWVFDESTGMLTFDGEGVVSSRKGWEDLRDKIKIIYISKGITGIRNELLYGSSYRDTSLKNLEHFEVENGNADFGTIDGVLFNYDKTELIYYPAGRIGTYEIPAGVIKIGDHAFSGCRQLTSVNITDSVEVIGREAFYPSNLSAVQIGKGVKHIERQAFSTCGSLSSIVIPENVESLGYRAFEYCGYDDYPGLQSVTILGKDTKMLDASGNVNRQDADTFAYCKGLKEVTLACNAGVNAFRDCKALTNVNIIDGAEEIEYEAFSGCSNIENIQLPESLKRIGNDAFATDKITEFYIPANLEEMNGAAVRLCKNLASFIIDEKNKNFVLKDDVLYDSALTALIKYPRQKKDLTDYEVPDGITRISNGAFYGCEILKEISLPKSLREVERYAFAACPSLKNVVIPEGVKILYGPMFNKSNSLEYIVIPQSVTDIGSSKNVNHMLEWVDFDVDIYCYTSDLFPSSQYYEDYIRLDNGIKVSYDVNGGNSDIIEQIVYPSRPYEDMPVPTRKGYTFAGWYTQKDGGKKITDDSVVDKIADFTLYAHWETSEEKMEVDNLSYSFGNNNRAFGYEADYMIPLKVFQNIWGNTPKAKYEYISQGVWGGSCYGMAATSGMFNTGNSNVEVQKFRSDANKVCDLKTGDINTDWNMDLREFIETLFVSQHDLPIQRAYYDGKDKLSELCRIVKKGDELVLIAVFGAEGGHALLGYRLENVDAVTDKLYVYDCNYPLQERYITLTKDAKGDYSKWYYYLNNRYHWGTGYEDSWISYIPYDKYASEWHNSAVQRDMNMLYLNVSDAVIEDADGVEAARITDNKLQTERPDIIQVIDTGITSDGQMKKMPNLIYLPTDTYVIRNLDHDTDNFEIRFVDNDFGIQVTTTADNAAVTADDDSKNSSVYISSDPGDTYEMKLETSCDKNYHTVQVDGRSTGETIGAELNNGLVSLVNCSENNMSMEVDGNSSKYHTIELKAEQGGTISPSGTYYAIPGSTAEFTVKPDNGYDLEDVLIDDNSIGAVGQYALSNIDSSHKVLAKFRPKNVLVENIKLNLTSTSLQDKSTMKLEAAIIPENAANKELKWSSENNNVAMVNSQGMVTAVGIGRTTITVEAMDGSGKKASCVITVTTKPDNGMDPGGNTSGGGSSSGGITPGGNNQGGNSNSGTSPGGNSNGDNLIVRLSYYIVAFDANAGTGLSRKTITLLMDDTLGILPKVQRRNYRFNGWYTQRSGGSRVDSSTILNAATTLYAQWTEVAKPGKVSSLKLKSAKKNLTVSFKKVSGAAGYQIVYSTDKKFKASAAKKVLTASLSKTVKNLKKNKTYYVKVRAYKTDSAGNKIYGAYSERKSIKVKA